MGGLATVPTAAPVSIPMCGVSLGLTGARRLLILIWKCSVALGCLGLGGKLGFYILYKLDFFFLIFFFPPHWLLFQTRGKGIQS